ncbi:D-Lactate dehydrogenase [Pseudoalteromonas luteoviolacea B = ATCC 29581]|nr:D-Lactate dehydrogenase [Pseudoalteromonas luteoviolacea B = ATCC 29581]
MYKKNDIKATRKLASDNKYKTWIRDLESNTPARYNADKRLLHTASGCAGKLVVFAVRLDSFVKHNQKETFFISTNSTESLNALRVSILKSMTNLPVSAEYLHRNVIELTDAYGRDTMLVLKYFGTDVMQRFFTLKKSLEQWSCRIPFMSEHAVDRITHLIARSFPSQVSKMLKSITQSYEHHLILTIKDTSKVEFHRIYNETNTENTLNIVKLNEYEAKRAYLLRYAAAGAAIQFQKLNQRLTSGLIALDIALPRNCTDWFEQLPNQLKKR